jgi:hypothetical protein
MTLPPPPAAPGSTCPLTRGRPPSGSAAVSPVVGVTNESSLSGAQGVGSSPAPKLRKSPRLGLARVPVRGRRFPCLSPPSVGADLQRPSDLLPGRAGVPRRHRRPPARPVPGFFLTAAAPNRSAIRRTQPERLADIPIILRRRAARILDVAAAEPWGCSKADGPGWVRAAHPPWFSRDRRVRQCRQQRRTRYLPGRRVWSRWHLIP